MEENGAKNEKYIVEVLPDAVEPGGNRLKALEEVVGRAKLIVTPNFGDESMLKIAFVLMGIDPEWKTCGFTADGERLTFDFKGIFSDEPRCLKHGGRVKLSYTKQTKLVMVLSPEDCVEVNKLTDEDAAKEEAAIGKSAPKAPVLAWRKRYGMAATA